MQMFNTRKPRQFNYHPLYSDFHEERLRNMSGRQQGRKRMGMSMPVLVALIVLAVLLYFVL